MGESPNQQISRSVNKVSVVIPAYNEERSIAEIVRRLRAVDDSFEIIVVDDGSSDATAALAAEAGAQVVAHPYNIGNGAAVKTGVRQASGDVVVLMDADGQHDPSDIPTLLADIGPYDMVVGARTKESEVSAFRAFGNWGLVQVANYLAGMRIPDLTSGFRSIKRERMVEFLHLLPNTFSYPTTITLALLKSGYPVKWVPLKSIKKREQGESKIKPIRDGLRFVNIMLRVVMLFDPQKVFLPASGLLLVAGAMLIVYNVWATGGVQESSMLLIITGVFTFFFGLLAEQIAHLRREVK